MKSCLRNFALAAFFGTLFALTFAAQTFAAEGVIFVEAESFAEKGGWVVDQQMFDVLGSPALLAHGAGVPVADAKTEVTFPQKGTWRVFVRTHNWVARWAPRSARRLHPVGER